MRRYAFLLIPFLFLLAACGPAGANPGPTPLALSASTASLSVSPPVPTAVATPLTTRATATVVSNTLTPIPQFTLPPAITPVTLDASGPCPKPIPVATPPWPSSPAPLPQLPASTMLIAVGNATTPPAPCLVALDAEGRRVWGTPSHIFSGWQWHPSAQLLTANELGPKGTAIGLFWNHPFGDARTQSLDKTPGRPLQGFVVSPDGQSLVYLEQDEWNPPHTYAADWQVARVELATNRRQVLLHGQMNIATTAPPRAFSGNASKRPFGWSAATGLIYLVESDIGGNAPLLGLWSMRPDGSALTQVVFADEKMLYPVLLSPDGKLILYEVHNAALKTPIIDATFGLPANELRSLDVSTGHKQTLLADPKGLEISGLRWAPDSQQVLFSRRLENSGLFDLSSPLIMRADGTEMRPLVPLDPKRNERIMEMIECTSHDLLYVINRDGKTADYVLTNLQDPPHKLMTLPGNWSLNLVACLQ